jgi:hypothetical protein
MDKYTIAEELKAIVRRSYHEESSVYEVTGELLVLADKLYKEYEAELLEKLTK